MSVSIKPSPVIKGKSAKKLLDSMNNPPDNSELFKKCEELSFLFIAEDGHLDLDKVLSEVKFLYKTYGLESDNNLHNDAKTLKERILNFVNEVKNL